MKELQKNIIDCFLLNNELDVLEIRLSLLSPYVSLFILVESCKTFDGQDKPFYYEENRERFKDYSDKILYIKVEDMPNEKGKDYQRNAISDTVHYLHKQKNLNIDDLVFMSNISEVPEMVKLAIYLQGPDFKAPLVLDMKINNVDKHKKGTVISTVKEVLSLGVLYLVNNKSNYPSISNGRLFNGKQ
tara:strand:+ start:491 stop:1051 length:561 start_codon:yes stop_codon:yes gene_type:complete